MADLVLPSPMGIEIINAIVGLADWATAKLKLFANDISPTPSTVIADFVEPAYSGYVAKTITWSPGFYDANGIPVSSSGELLFSQSGSTGSLVYGAFITDAAGTLLLASARMDGAPFSFAGNGDTLPLLLKLDASGGLLSVSPVP